MKSSINTLFDFKDVPFDRKIEISCPQEHIDFMLKRLTRKHKQVVAAETVESGDVLALSLQSEIEKFNKPATFVTVGSGIFDEEIENALIGKTKGESFELKKDGKQIVVCIKSIQRSVYPKATDAMAVEYAKENEFDDIKNLQDYIDFVKKLYIEEERHSKFYEVMEYVVEYVLTHTDFDFDAEELKKYAAMTLIDVEEDLDAEGKTLQTLSQSELEEFFGVSTAEDAIKTIENSAEFGIAQILWLAKMHNIDAKEIEMEEFDRYDFQFLEDYLSQNIIFKEV